MSELRESGSIEQDADIILLLYRESYFDEDKGESVVADENKAQVIIAKNRHGGTTDVDLTGTVSILCLRPRSITEMNRDVLSATKKYNMLSYGDKIVVGLSGGADSVCLTHALVSLRDSLSLEVEAVHVNHGIRGEEALRDENLFRFLQKPGNKIDRIPL